MTGSRLRICSEKLRNMDKLLLNSFRETDTMYKIWKGGFE